jgi:hypothetical protein
VFPLKRVVIVLAAELHDSLPDLVPLSWRADFNLNLLRELGDCAGLNIRKAVGMLYSARILQAFAGKCIFSMSVTHYCFRDSGGVES